MKLEGIFLCPLISLIGSLVEGLLLLLFKMLFPGIDFVLLKIWLLENVALNNVMNRSYIVTVMTMEICSNISYGNMYTFFDK